MQSLQPVNVGHKREEEEENKQNTEKKKQKENKVKRKEYFEATDHWSVSMK